MKISFKWLRGVEMHIDSSFFFKRGNLRPQPVNSLMSRSCNQILMTLYCHRYDSFSLRRFFSTSRGFTRVDFQNPFVNTASIVLLLWLTDGALLPSKRRLHSGCGVWAVAARDHGAVDGWGRALLDVRTLWGMINLTIYISAVNCLLAWVDYLSASEGLLSSFLTNTWGLSPHWQSVCLSQC